MRKTKTSFLICLILFLSVSPIWATTQYYYLRATGAGSNSGDTGTWNVVPTSDGNAMSASNFNTSGNWSATENVNLLDPDDVVYVKGSGWTSSYNLTPVYGITIDGKESGDYDPDSESHTIDPVMYGYIDIDVDDVTVQDMRMSAYDNDIRIGIYNGSKVSGATIKRNFINLQVTATGSGIKVGFMVDSEISYNYIGDSSFSTSDCCYGLSCGTGTWRSRGISFAAGSRNKIIYNTIKGGKVAAWFNGAMSWDTNLYDIDYPSSGSYTIDPDVNYRDNEIAYNNIDGRCQEGISFDPNSDANAFSTVERDTVSNVVGTTITLNNGGGEWTGAGNKWSGFYIFAIPDRDNTYGNHALITAQADNVLTVDSAITNLAIGDEIIIGQAVKNNWIHHNEWQANGFQGSSLLFEGNAVENLIEENIFPNDWSENPWRSEGFGIAVKGLYGWIKSVYSETQAASTSCCAYNIVRNNTVERILVYNHDKKKYPSDTYSLSILRNNAVYDNDFYVSVVNPRKMEIKHANVFVNNNTYIGNGDVNIIYDEYGGLRLTDPTGYVSDYFDGGGAPTPTPDTTPPEVVEAIASGSTVTIHFSENVDMTGYDYNDFVMNCDQSGSSIHLPLSSSGVASTQTFAPAVSIIPGETCTLDYGGGAGEVQDEAGNSLATFIDFEVDTGDATSMEPAGKVGYGAEILIDGGAEIIVVE